MTRFELKVRRMIVKAIEGVRDEGTLNMAEIVGAVLAGIAFIVMLGAVGTIEITVGYIPMGSVVTVIVAAVYIMAYALLVLARKEID